MSQLQQMDKAFVSGTYNRFPVSIVSGKGSTVYDENGKKYIDMGSGIGATAFGIADEKWNAAVTAQLQKVQHMSNLYYTEPCAKLAQMICEKTGMSKVFFGNSGAEANECLIKIARKYAAETKGNDHFTIVTLEQSFHGRTLSTLAATGQDHFHQLFQPLTPGFAYVEANNIDREEIWVGNTIQFSGEMRALVEQTVKDLGFRQVYWTDCGGVITTHGGPNAFGLAGYSAN